ncbi:MAG: DUF1549 domain-containing protein, partial [Armatimonadetes bacterium]|nr:DUF1549 domain-containing protein [Armatimonadota bacterium]
MTVPPLALAALLAVGIIAGPVGAAPPARRADRATTVSRRPVPAVARRPEFLRDVLPLLSRAGCNTGTCHGAAIGQGGFRLSLLGYDPEADHASITRELEGRRVDLEAPAASLLLRKPAGTLPHGGGKRLLSGSSGYETVRAWIAQGAAAGDLDRKVTRLEVSPADVLLPGPGRAVPLRVRAIWSDGSAQDATGLALFTSYDPSLVVLDQGGSARLLRPGVGIVMVRYQGQAVSVRLAAPLGRAPLRASGSPPAHPIDRAVWGELARLRVAPAGRSEDAAFLRRIYLDLIGLLPAEEEVRTFLEQARRDPQARTRLVGELLQRPEFAEYWSFRLADSLQLNPKGLGAAGATAYHSWLQEQVARNRPLGSVVRDLLLGSGDPAQVGPANFYRVAADPRDTAEYVSRTLLGIRVACARCHHHPFDRWGQDDYSSFAALFARVRYDGTAVRVTATGEVPHPRTGRRAPPRVLLGADTASVPEPVDRRLLVADWLAPAGRSNGSAAPAIHPLLARSLANRIWKWVVGRGVVEPTDDLRPTNPPSNPALLEVLTARFQQSGGDLREFLSFIVQSETYQRSSHSAGNPGEGLFARAILKPLVGQVLADALSQATGVPDRYGPEG